jgi:hypothetical protein
MTFERDWDYDMHGPAIDESTADRLLTGRLAPDDAPPGFVGLAAMIRAATGPATSAESKRDAAVIAAALVAVRSSQPMYRSASRRRSMLSKLLSAKVAGLVAGAVLGSTGVAAAATGNLPAPAQTAVSDAMSHVSVSVPSGNRHGAGHGKSEASHGKSANGTDQTDANGNSQFGLCTAFLAAPNDHANAQSGQNTNSGKDDSTAFTKLIADNGGSVASATAHCNTVVAEHSTGAAGGGGENGNNQGHGNQPANPGQPGQPANPGKPANTGKPAQPGQSGNAGGNGAANEAAHRP